MIPSFQPWDGYELPDVQVLNFPFLFAVYTKRKNCFLYKCQVGSYGIPLPRWECWRCELLKIVKEKIEKQT